MPEIDNSLLARLERHKQTTEATGLIGEAIIEIRDLRSRLSLIAVTATNAVKVEN